MAAMDVLMLQSNVFFRLPCTVNYLKSYQDTHVSLPNFTDL